MFNFDKKGDLANNSKHDSFLRKWMEKAGKHGNTLKLFILLAGSFLVSQEAFSQNKNEKLDGKNISVENNGVKTMFNFESGADSAMNVNGVVFKEEDGTFLLNGKKIDFHDSRGADGNVDIRPGEIKDLLGDDDKKIKVLSIKFLFRSNEDGSEYVDVVNISDGEVVSTIFAPEKYAEKFNK